MISGKAYVIALLKQDEKRLVKDYNMIITRTGGVGLTKEVHQAAEILKERMKQIEWALEIMVIV